MSNLYLVDITAKDLAGEPIRKGFGRGLKKAGELDANVVAACADLTGDPGRDAVARHIP